jgi:Flp pilus assembly protein TadG
MALSYGAKAPERDDRRRRLQQLQRAVRDESGQSLVVVGIAMVVILGMCALAIDVGQWYVKHHQAQVAADATALAGANCLATGKCSQTTWPTGDTATQMQKVATPSGVTISSVTISGSTVKVTAQNTVTAPFAGVFGIGTVTTSATATASYKSGSGINFTCTATGSAACLSLFAGNKTCPSPAPTIPSNFVGLDLVVNDSGGGSSNMQNMFTNGYYYNGGNSNSSTFTTTEVGTGSPHCGTEQKPTTTFSNVSSAVPYPAVWSKPTCTYTATSWTTTSVASDGPGVFCITSGTTPSTCTDGGTGSGTIDVNMASTSPALTTGGYEFVGPCVTIAGLSATATNISGQPLVYGTSNTTTAATSTALPTCVKNDGTNLTSTFLDASTTDAPPIFDQCGTVEATGNGGYVGFVEAWNIAIDKNNNVIGNGPTSITGGGENPTSGSDTLTG